LQDFFPTEMADLSAIEELSLGNVLGINTALQVSSFIFIFFLLMIHFFGQTLKPYHIQINLVQLNLSPLSNPTLPKLTLLPT